MALKACGKKAVVLDPFLKLSQSQDFISYRDFFGLVDGDATLIEEFDQYLGEPISENPELQTLDFWKAAIPRFPNISPKVLQLLSIPKGSCEVEISFSKLRNLQNPF